MAQLNIKADYIQMLILKVREIMVKEGAVMPDPGSNPTDDQNPAVLQDIGEDLTREEVVAEIRGLIPEQQDELVALMWLGRGDMEPEEFADAVKQAAERRETPTEDYLLGIPLLADYWAEALDRLELGGAIDEVEEI